MFPEIKILKLKFYLKPSENIYLPEYKGSTFRGAFGHAFKKAVCVFHNLRDCNECMVRKQCIYLNIFETPMPENINEETLKFLRISKSEKGPHPFIIEPAKEKNTIYTPEDILTFDFIILGKATQYYPYFVHTVSEIGKMGIGKKRGKFAIESITVYSSPVATVEIFDKNKNTLKEFNNDFIIKKELITNCNKVTLDFITPLRLMKMGELNDDISFSDIIINLIRRISGLLVFYYDFNITKEYIEYCEKLIADSQSIEIQNSKLKWYSWERYSNRTEKRINLGGLLGEISFEGNLSPFMEILKTGEELHTGKNTIFGLGQYVVSGIGG